MSRRLSKKESWFKESNFTAEDGVLSAGVKKSEFFRRHAGFGCG